MLLSVLPNTSQKHLPTSNDNTTVIQPSLPAVTTPLLSSSPRITTLQEIPPITTSTIHPDTDTKADNSIPLSLVVQQPLHIYVLVPLPSPTNPPTPVVVTTLLWSSSTDIPQFQPLFFPLLRHAVPAAAAAAEQATLMYLFLLVYGHIPWFRFSPPVQKHEWEPPQNKVLGFNFELSLEGKAISRVRKLIHNKM